MESVLSAQNTESVIKNLKVKCNRLIDTLREKEKEIGRLSDENNMLKESMAEENRCEEMRVLHSFLDEFFLVITNAIQQNAVVPFMCSKESEFINIDCDDFERLIGVYSQLSVQEFLNYCVMFRLLFTGTCKQKKAKVNKIWVYKVSKRMAEYMAGALSEPAESKKA